MPMRPKRHQPVKPAARRTTSEAWRPSAHARGYGRAWAAASKGYLQHHALCVHCLADGLVTASVLVDHIRPHRLSEALASGDEQRVTAARALFWDHDNWQALCKTCHDRKTATEDGGFGNRRKER